MSYCTFCYCTFGDLSDHDTSTCEERNDYEYRVSLSYEEFLSQCIFDDEIRALMDIDTTYVRERIQCFCRDPHCTM